MRRRRQAGIALVTAILVVSLATIAATAILTSANIAIHRTQNLQDSEKAWWYAEGVESWVKSVLERDLDDNKFDSLSDVWARPDNYFPVDEGFLRGSVIDLQGRFNLNSLGEGTTQAESVFEGRVQQFERLWRQLELGDPFQARAVAHAIRDWIDLDIEPTGFDGAEDSEYLSATPPRRVPNRPMESVTELLAIKGMTKEIYLKLRDHVAVLPVHRNQINVNTATEPVLRSLAKDTTPELDQFLRERVEKPEEERNKATRFFVSEPGLEDRITISTEFFLLRSEAVIGAGRIGLYSHIYRPAQGKPVVLGHSLDVE